VQVAPQLQLIARYVRAARAKDKGLFETLDVAFFSTLLLALFACLVNIGILWRRRWARRVAIWLQAACLVGSAFQLLLPLGANHGPVGLLTNVALPAAVIWLLWGRRTRAVFG